MMYRTSLILVTLVVLGACGGGSSSREPEAAINQAPAISSQSDLRINANEAAKTSLNISDDLTAVDELVITAESSNDELLPAQSISIVGTGANREVTLTPRIDTLGSAALEFVVTDSAGLSGRTSVAVEVISLPTTAAEFSRSLASLAAEDEPLLVNALEFDDNAQDDDFADLLQ